MGEYIAHGNEVCRYGVLGMRWGVRKNPAKAYAKASRKDDRLDQKSIKKGLESAKLSNKHNKRIKSMEKAFSEVKISDISPEALEIGKKYTYMLLKDETAN